MRTAYIMTGIGALVIIGGLFINQRFTPPVDTSKSTIISNATTSMNLPDSLTISSSDFLNDGPIPFPYTCDGEGMNPPLTIEGVPDEAKSLVLIVYDPDVPRVLKSDGNFDHWVLYNIPPDTRAIESGGSVGTVGKNSAGNIGYAPPCPPKEHEPSEHRYFFKLSALDSELSLDEGATRVEVENAMRDHMIANSQLVGRYKRK